MSTNRRVCTVVCGSLPFTAVYEISAYAGAHAAGLAQPPTWMIAAGLAPQVLAAAVVVAILLRSEPAPTVVGEVPTQGRPVEPRRPRELTR